MKIEKLYLLIAVLGLVSIILTGMIVIDFIQHYQMLVFERELDNAVELTKLKYSGGH